jgi:hypothetical protein
MKRPLWRARFADGQAHQTQKRDHGVADRPGGHNIVEPISPVHDATDCHRKMAGRQRLFRSIKRGMIDGGASVIDEGDG